MKKKLEQSQPDLDKRDLEMIRQIKKYADRGYHVEVNKAKDGGYKTLWYEKHIVKAD